MLGQPQGAQSVDPQHGHGFSIVGEQDARASISAPPKTLLPEGELPIGQVETSVCLNGPKMRSLSKCGNGIERQLIGIGNVLRLRWGVFLTGRTVLIFAANVNCKRTRRSVAGEARNVIGPSPIGTAEVIRDGLRKVKRVP